MDAQAPEVARQRVQHGLDVLPEMVKFLRAAPVAPGLLVDGFVPRNRRPFAGIHKLIQRAFIAAEISGLGAPGPQQGGDLVAHDADGERVGTGLGRVVFRAPQQEVQRLAWKPIALRRAR